VRDGTSRVFYKTRNNYDKNKTFHILLIIKVFMKHDKKIIVHENSGQATLPVKEMSDSVTVRCLSNIVLSHVDLI
jgi:hypothetical protein